MDEKPKKRLGRRKILVVLLSSALICVNLVLYEDRGCRNVVLDTGEFTLMIRGWPVAWYLLAQNWYIFYWPALIMNAIAGAVMITPIVFLLDYLMRLTDRSRQEPPKDGTT